MKRKKLWAPTPEKLLRMLSALKKMPHIRVLHIAVPKRMDEELDGIIEYTVVPLELDFLLERSQAVIEVGVRQP